MKPYASRLLRLQLQLLRLRLRLRFLRLLRRRCFLATLLDLSLLHIFQSQHVRWRCLRLNRRRLIHDLLGDLAQSWPLAWAAPLEPRQTDFATFLVPQTCRRFHGLEIRIAACPCMRQSSARPGVAAWSDAHNHAPNCVAPLAGHWRLALVHGHLKIGVVRLKFLMFLGISIRVGLCAELGQECHRTL